jgi:hypothetical protein
VELPLAAGDQNTYNTIQSIEKQDTGHRTRGAGGDVSFIHDHDHDRRAVGVCMYGVRQSVE